MRKISAILICYALFWWDRIKEYFPSIWEKIKCPDSMKLFIMLLLLFFCTTFFIANGISLRIQRDTYFILSLILCSGLYVAMRDKFAGAFIFYCAIVAITKGIDVQIAIFLISFIAIYISVSHYNGRRDVVYDVIILIAGINLIMQVSQFFPWPFDLPWPHNPIEGTRIYPGLMANRNETSALYAITAAACLRKGRYPFLAISIAGLCMSVSLGGVLAFSVMMVVWSIRNSHRLPVLRAGKYPGVKYAIPGVMISVIITFVLFYGTVIHPFDIQKRKQNRFFVWEQTAKVAMIQHTGWGWNQYRVIMTMLTSWVYLPENTKVTLKSMVRDRAAFNQAIQKVSGNDLNIFEDKTRMQNAVFVEAHNEYVEFLFTAGWIGLLIGFVFLGATLWTAFKSVDPVPFYGIIASCISAVTFFTWHQVPLAIITVFYFAWAKGEKP